MSTTIPAPTQIKKSIPGNLNVGRLLVYFLLILGLSVTLAPYG